jgi:hypothetical protein
MLELGPGPGYVFVMVMVINGEGGNDGKYIAADDLGIENGSVRSRCHDRSHSWKRYLHRSLRA